MILESVIQTGYTVAYIDGVKSSVDVECDIAAVHKHSILVPDDCMDIYRTVGIIDNQINCSVY